MNIKEFKDYVVEDLLEEFKWLEHNDVFHWITSNNRIVVNLENLDVNYDDWHDNLLEGHQTFKFDYRRAVELTPNNYEEFKQVLRDYEKKYIKGEQ